MTKFRCPLCQQALELTLQSYQCSNKHCFDLAKEGYVNLLPVQKKKSKLPGDSASMIQARRRFLDHGYYGGFAKTLCDLIDEQDSINTLLDIGCGEGYYTSQIKQRLPAVDVSGIDISKAGVRLCSKKHASGQFAVASAYELPFIDDQFDCAVSIFSPISLTEAARVMRQDSRLYVCGPGPNHLRALASIVYDTPKVHEDSELREPSSLLHLSATHRYENSISVSGAHLLDLLQMTPYYWHCSDENKTKLTELDSLAIELDFSIRVYSKS